MKTVNSLSPKIFPKNVHLEITQRCNMRCLHCFLDDKPEEPELTTREWYTIIRDLARLGGMTAIVTGGEPMLREDFLDICSFLNDCGFVLKVNTNGTLVTQEIASGLASLKVGHVQVSLYGGTPVQHELVTQIESSFSSTLRGIRLLLKAGVSVQASAVIMRQNLEAITGLRAFCNEMGIALIESPLILASVSGRKHLETLRLTQQELSSYIITAPRFEQMDEAVEKPIPPGLRPEGVCIMAKQNIAVSPRGIVMPCLTCRIACGDLRKQHVEQVWKRSPILERLRKLTMRDMDCRDCPLNGLCRPCPGAALLMNGRLTKPDGYACKYMKMYIKQIGMYEKVCKQSRLLE